MSRLSDKQAVALASFRKQNELDEQKCRQREDRHMNSIMTEAEDKAFAAQISAEHEVSRARM